MPERIPAFAERHGWAPIQTEKVASRYAMGAQALRPIVVCPGCGSHVPPPDPISEPFMCVGLGSGCGLMMQIECDGLWIWREPSKQAAE